ncbi:MAG: glycoside hydrolase family 32 protein [Acidobacteriaceae bacterium]|nr:glycoside hydrolase family 32 protein [Acidobacteriaceae bacterium]
MLTRLLLITFAVLLGAPGQIAPEYDQPYRPQFHFSPRENWTNDPNGLVFFSGEYHLFFQYNPFGDEWGHMSWGHAVSRDLLHWDQRPVAIPEQDGIMIFTGSTVVDARNSSGFCTKPEGCMVAVYTGHTPPEGSRPALQTQNLAFSNDRGRTWTKYPGNPVLNLHMTDFRDPKVLWSEETGEWVMAVSLPNEHKVRFYTSPDLKHWTHTTDFGPEGATGGQWECPELFQLPLEGSTETRWVLKVGLNPGGLQGGSGEQYFVGRFNGRRFVNDNPATLQLWTDYGKDCYCALTFNGLPRTQSPVMIGWMDNWQYAAKLPTRPWRGQMTFPRSLSLRKTADGIRLIQQPYQGIERLQQKRLEATSGSDLDAVNQALRAQPLSGHSFRLRFEIQLGDAREAGVRMLANHGSFTLIGYDREAKKLFIDRRHSGVTGFSGDFPARIDAPLPLTADKLVLDVLVDRNSVEVFADNGRITCTMLVFPSSGANGIEFYANRTGRVSASVRSVESIWQVK